MFLLNITMKDLGWELEQCKQKQNIVLGVFLFFCHQSAECLLCLDCYFQTEVAVGDKFSAIHRSAHIFV